METVEDDNNPAITKGIVMLNALMAKRQFKKVCRLKHLSYKFCHAVAEGRRSPTWKMMNNLLFLIPPNFWFEEADEEFINAANESVQS